MLVCIKSYIQARRNFNTGNRFLLSLLVMACFAGLTGCMVNTYRSYYYKPTCTKDSKMDGILNVTILTSKYALVQNQQTTCIGGDFGWSSHTEDYGPGSCQLNYSCPTCDRYGLRVEGSSYSNTDGLAYVNIYPLPLFAEIKEERPDFYGLKQPAYSLWNERAQDNAYVYINIDNQTRGTIEFEVYSLYNPIKKFLRDNFCSQVTFQVRDIDSHMDITGYNLKVTYVRSSELLNQLRQRLLKFFSEKYTDAIMENNKDFGLLADGTYTTEQSSIALYLYTPFEYEIEVTHPNYNYYHGTFNITSSRSYVIEMSELGTKTRVRVVPR